VRSLAVLVFLSITHAARADAILTWNNALLDAVRQTSALLVDGPPEVARQMAMVDIAMYDAVNAATGLTYQPYAYTGNAAFGVSADAAALSAGYQTMKSVFSSPLWRLAPPAGSPAIAAEVLTNIRNTYKAGLAGLDLSDPAVVGGLALGATAANAIIANRRHDGSSAAIINGLIPYTPPGSGTTPGVYVPPSATGGRPAMFPRWGTVVPFGTTADALLAFEEQLPTVQEIDKVGFAAFISSPGYAKQVLQTECVGVAGSLSRSVAHACASAGFLPASPAQTKAALFWNDPGGTMQPPGHWLQIADTVIEQPGTQLSELQKARLSALLGMAEADAGIAAWDLKYKVNLWRPITAIHDCSDWNSQFTTCDATWSSLIATPPHPDYVAGHPTFSNAAATVLADFYGSDNVAFCSTSDPYINGSQGFVGPLSECFDSFLDASSGPIGAAFSRVTGGIHTPLAVQDGLQLGQLIGVEVFANNLQPIAEPAAGLLLLPWLAALPLLRRASILAIIGCLRPHSFPA
jgi:hypothetical protein